MTTTQTIGFSWAAAITGIRKKPLINRYGVQDTLAELSVIKVSAASVPTSMNRASQDSRSARSRPPRISAPTASAHTR